MIGKLACATWVVGVLAAATRTVGQREPGLPGAAPVPLVEPYSAPSTPPIRVGRLYIGRGRGSIAPDPLVHPVPLGGYGDRAGRPATGVRDPVEARALWLTLGEEPVVLVSCDLCFIPSGLKDRVRSALAAEGVALEPAQLVLAATHTHAGPEPMAMHAANRFANPRLGVRDETLEAAFIRGVVAAVRESRAIMPAEVSLARVSAEGLVENRRGADCREEGAWFLRFRRPAGALLAVAWGWTAHPTLLGPDAMELSAGWPGAVNRRLEAEMSGEEGALALFFNGAQGDQRPRGAEGQDGWERMADYAAKVWDRLRPLLRAEEGPGIGPWENRPALAVRHGWIELPARRAHPSFLEIAGQEYGVESPAAAAMVEALFPRRCEIGWCRIGGLGLVAFPGEALCSVGRDLREAAAAPDLRVAAVAGLANDYIGYVLPAAEYEAGGYEATASFYGPQLAGAMVEGLRRITAATEPGE